MRTTKSGPAMRRSTRRQGAFAGTTGIFVLLGIFVGATGCGPRLPPGVYASPSMKDLGVVADKDRVVADFEVVNTTALPVRILQTQQSCGCTSVDLPSDTIPPGGSIPVSVTIDLGGQYGRKDFESRLHTDSRVTPIVALGVRADVSAKRVDAGAPFEIGSFPPGGDLRGTAAVYKGTNESARAVGCEPGSAGSIRFSVAEADTPGFFEVTASGTAPSTPGPFDLAVDVVARGGSWERRRIVFHGSVKPRWLVPEIVSLGFLEPGKTVSRNVSIDDAFAGTVQPRVIAVTAESSAAWLSADATLTPERRIVLSLDAAHPGRAEPVEAAVTTTIRTDDSRSATATAVVSLRGL